MGWCYMIDNFLEMNTITLTLIASLFTWGLTAMGASLVFFFKKVNRNVMDAMLGFAAGVMIAASFWSLLSPGIELAEDLGKCSWLVATLGFLSGGIILYLGDKLCKYFMKKRKSTNSEGLRRSILLVSSISLHNIPEGCVMYVYQLIKQHNIR